MTRLVWARSQHVPGMVRLLHEKMNSRLSPERWAGLFDYPWLARRPDYGVAAVVEAEAPGSPPAVVGAHVHIYADRSVTDVSGRRRCVRFANLSSWYVDKAHRGGGTGSGMVRMAVSMPGVVCTVFSLSRLRVEFYRGLGLEVLEESRLLWKKRGHAPDDLRVEQDPARIAALVESMSAPGAVDDLTCGHGRGPGQLAPMAHPDNEDARRQTQIAHGQGAQHRACGGAGAGHGHSGVFHPDEADILRDMAPYSVRPVLLECEGRWCLLYLSVRPKGEDVLHHDVLRCTHPDFLARHGQRVADALLPQGAAVLASDRRFVPGESFGAVEEGLDSPRFYTPGIVPPIQVDMLYSELQLLDLKLA